MSQSLSSLSTFHLTGERHGKDFGDIGQLGLRPALFSAYQDISKLRHDFPLVLVDGGDNDAFVLSLSDIIDDVLQKIAPRGVEGERIRKHVLGLEDEIRTLVDRGTKGTLLQLWDMAETNRLSKADKTGRDLLGDSLSRARSGLGVDGVLVGYAGDTPVQIFTHAWARVQKNKARKFAKEIGELTVKLSNILKANTMHSEKALSPKALKGSVGTVYEDAFDFETMSDILGSSLVNGAVPDKKRRRIRATLAALKSQKFFGVVDDGTYDFVFDRPTRALKAFRQRLPEMINLVKAMTIARLEIEGRYKEETHDAFFRTFDERFLGPDDLGNFPSYLVCLRNDADAKGETAMLAEVLSSGLPMKVLMQSDDILEELANTPGRFSPGLRCPQLAAMAIGLNGAFVLQSSGSALYRMREQVMGGLKNGQPALFSIFSGLVGDSPGPFKNTPETTPYLKAAAALESRAFPSFVYNPALGDDWASRFSVMENPQTGTEWPVHRFSYEDENLQKITEDIAFTVVDFAAADVRFCKNFADVPRSEWLDAMVPVDAFLKLDAEASAGKVPYVLMVDENNILHKVIVDVRLIDAAHRCREMWRNLQELGGIDNSHARDLLAKEKEKWEQEKEQELEALRHQPASEQPTPAPENTPLSKTEPAHTEPEDEQQLAPSNEPYIETPRCTTCDECTQINNRMFAYDDNKQAFIADLDAGTFRQLVEAAESCQVAIIHPGKPKNTDEPDLDESMARAEAFN